MVPPAEREQAIVTDVQEQRTTRRLLTAFAAVAVLAAVLRVLPIDQSIIDREKIDEKTLLLLALAGIFLLLRNVDSFAQYLMRRVEKVKVGDVEVTLAQVAKQAEEAKIAAEYAQVIAFGTGKPPEANAQPVVGDEPITPGSDPADRWRGRFGGASAVRSRRLQAEVSEVPGLHGVFRVRLWVSSVDPRDPLTGVVQFYLHETFKNDRPAVPVGPDGIAELVLRAWGCFTVGAVADGGRTRLELNLCALPSAPALFKSR
jgi:hypothetical protein